MPYKRRKVHEWYLKGGAKFRQELWDWLSDYSKGGELGQYFISFFRRRIRHRNGFCKSLDFRTMRCAAIVLVITFLGLLIQDDVKIPWYETIFENLESIALGAAGIIFLFEIRERQKREHYEAWRVINSAQGQPGSGGRIQALEDLNRDGVNLEGVAAPRADLSGINLRGANLKRANFKKTQLDKAHLEGANLEGSNLKGAYLQGANLEGAYLRGANLEGAYLRGANLKGAYLQEANLKGACLYSADLEGANLWHAFLEEAVLGSQCYRVEVQMVDPSVVRRSRSNMGYVVKHDDMLAAAAKPVNLKGPSRDAALATNLKPANLKGANLFRAHLEGASLGQVHLDGANLGYALLKGANLSHAHLDGANLGHVHLDGANLNGANLEGAKMREAHLSGAEQLTDNQLTKAKLCGTTLPKNSTLNPDRDCEELYLNPETGDCVPSNF
ncbi:putative low-complexity protein [Leptolyngbya sp. PCC 7375]|nr:putative low-complexity protein [Leptolyngbya sp. PCC 7375]